MNVTEFMFAFSGRRASESSAGEGGVGEAAGVVSELWLANNSVMPRVDTAESCAVLSHVGGDSVGNARQLNAWSVTVSIIDVCIFPLHLC